MNKQIKKYASTHSSGTVRVLLGFFSAAAVVLYPALIQSEGSASWPKVWPRKSVRASFGLCWMFFSWEWEFTFITCSLMESLALLWEGMSFSTETMLYNQGHRIAFILEESTKDTRLL